MDASRTATNSTRRDFLKTSAAAAIGTAGLMGTGNFAYAAGSDTMRVGVIGCGGRGTGAAKNAVEGSDGIVVHAMADLFEDRLDRSYEQLVEAIPNALQVSDDRKYTGFDAYKNLIDSGDVDLVIMATPPGFRPEHLRYAVEQGKHIFAEKPVAVDPVGVRHVMETAKMIDEKGLGFVAGTQRRHQAPYLEAIGRIHAGAIGEVVAGQVYWNQGELWLRERKPGMSDMEWQCRNWLYFTWLSGDHIVEQHIHNIDVANWVLQSHPVRANGVGGRQVRVDPSFGHIFDHFAVELEYPNGARILSMCRQQDGTARHVGEFFIGTKGTSDARGWIRGETAWRHREPEQGDVNPYVQEHTDLVASIRAGEPLNELHQMAETNMSAVLAREAAYTGQSITWDEIMSADLDLTPGPLAFGPLPTAPVPVPGKTQLARPPFDHAHEAVTAAGG